MTQPGSRGLDIAIIGGGASGTPAAVQLLRQAASPRSPLRIWLIDKHGRHGLGQAYSTEHPAHLLNAMAGQMSALPDEPDDLIRWAAHEASRASGRVGASQGAVTRTTFLARAD